MRAQKFAVGRRQVSTNNSRRYGPRTGPQATPQLPSCRPANYRHTNRSTNACSAFGGRRADPDRPQIEHRSRPIRGGRRSCWTANNAGKSKGSTRQELSPGSVLSCTVSSLHTPSALLRSQQGDVRIRPAVMARLTGGNKKPE